METTLYVSDLDGTLLTPQEQLSPFTTRVVNSLVEQGVHFTYATARSRHSAEVVTAGLTKNLPVIVYNGAFVIDGATGEKLVESAFTPEQIAQVRDLWPAAPVLRLCGGQGAGFLAGGPGQRGHGLLPVQPEGGFPPAAGGGG